MHVGKCMICGCHVSVDVNGFHNLCVCAYRLWLTMQSPMAQAQLEVTHCARYSGSCPSESGVFYRLQH